MIHFRSSGLLPHRFCRVCGVLPIACANKFSLSCCFFFLSVLHLCRHPRFYFSVLSDRCSRFVFYCLDVSAHSRFSRERRRKRERGRRPSGRCFIEKPTFVHDTKQSQTRCTQHSEGRAEGTKAVLPIVIELEAQKPRVQLPSGRPSLRASRFTPLPSESHVAPPNKEQQ